MPPAIKRRAGGQRVGDAVEPQQRQPAALRGWSPCMPTCLSPAITGDALQRREPS